MFDVLIQGLAVSAVAAAAITLAGAIFVTRYLTARRKRRQLVDG